MAGGQTRTAEEIRQDLDDLSRWFLAVRKALDDLERGMPVSTESWDPPGGIGPPICVPRCLPLPSRESAPTRIADLVQVLESLRDWTSALGQAIGKLPDPPPQP